MFEGLRCLGYYAWVLGQVSRSLTTIRKSPTETSPVNVGLTLTLGGYIDPSGVFHFLSWRIEDPSLRSTGPGYGNSGRREASVPEQPVWWF